MTAKVTYRSGHAGIRKILDDMHDVLPPERNGNTLYLRCRTMYGQIQTLHLKAEASDNPTKLYIEMQKLLPTLTEYLKNLKAKKGIPTKMAECLNELNVVLEAIVDGIELEDSANDSDTEMADDEPDARTEKPEPPVKITIKTEAPEATRGARCC
ncbi:hypothetical protein BDV95DRAFT_561286 [Massariosphaeria phaeospora]|uniref:Uncharacterized protein n=1 Tax=Massariosphaeria phaeospora TaxID=100035 RepID=A0A7C8MET7_9PLEO|nr:hypothetical protein BDV95DRAFT_561286 [Massariosphaeria phaeospora]